MACRNFSWCSGIILDSNAKGHDWFRFNIFWHNWYSFIYSIATWQIRISWNYSHSHISSKIFRLNVRFTIGKGQFNLKGNFDIDLPEAQYWMNIFSKLDLNLKILLLSYLHLLSSNCPVCKYSCNFLTLKL